MGYSHRLYLIEKKVLRQIKKMTPEEFRAWGVEKDIADESFDEKDPTYVPLYEIGTEFYDFGKYFEGAEKLEQTGTPLFKNKDLLDEYDHYSPFVVGKEAVLCAIEEYRKYIVNYYTKMLTRTPEDAENDYDERTKEQMLEDHAKSMCREWERLIAYDISDDTPAVTTSWTYEYAVFELVRLYKATNWKKYGLLFMGW